MIAAPASGSGKTVLTLGLLRALKNKGHDVSGAKAGPDYIDSGFHAVACKTPSVNLDPWAMDENRLTSLATAQSGDLVIIEAMMGLYDGAADGSGSAADLAKTLKCPIVLVVDATKQSHSIAALVRGFRDHDISIDLAGVILNKIGSARHEVMLRSALASIDMPVLGAVHRSAELALPERYLGLVQAGELQEIERFVENAANQIAASVDLDSLIALAEVSTEPDAKHNPKRTSIASSLPPLGQHIAIARDAAFTFIYPHMLADWSSAKAQLSFFSPLADESPDKSADAVFLPGGYPELHAGQLSACENFKLGMKRAQENDAIIYGECGGYMVLGERLTDKDGHTHAMTGLLNLETSFAKRNLHLGYRNLKTHVEFQLGTAFSAHEFHYTSAILEEGEPLFQAVDALGEGLGNFGLRKGNVMGSYMHIIDQRRDT